MSGQDDTEAGALLRQIDVNAVRVAKAGPEVLREHALQRAAAWTVSTGAEGYPDEDSPQCAGRWQHYADNAEQVCAELELREAAAAR